MKIFILIFVLSYSINIITNFKTCSEKQTLNQFSYQCSNDFDCLSKGIGSNCCVLNDDKYCISFNKSDKTPDCVLYEGNFTDNRIELLNGEIRKNLNYSLNYGYRSIQLASNCRLKLCYNSKTCYNHISNDYYKEKKKLPNFISCDCSYNKFVYEKQYHTKIAHEIKFLRPGEGTVKFNLGNDNKQLPNQFYIKIGEFEINFNQDKFEFLNYSNFSFIETLSKKKLSKPKILWLSFKSKEKSFIKIGFDKIMEKNLLNIYETSDLNTVKILSLVDEISIDENIVLKNKPEIILKAFDHDPIPILKCIHENQTESNQFSNYTLLINLPIELQQIYNKLNSTDLKFTQEDYESINYSLDNENCLLGNLAKNRFITVLQINHDKSMNLIKIWPKSYQINTYLNHEDQYGLNKVLNGELYIKFENGYKSYLKTGDVTWFTSDYNKYYKLMNMRKMNSSITIETIQDIKFKNIDFYLNDLLIMVKDEFMNRKCLNLKLECKCNFYGNLAGHLLKKIRFKCLDKLTKLQDNYFYYCDRLTKKIKKSIELDNLKQSKKVRKQAFVLLVPAYEKNITGYFLFEQIDNNNVTIKGKVSGLLPDSYHGMHIHEYGNVGNECRDTGPHFNPYMNDQHGDRTDHKYIKHAGDLGNIKTDINGNALINVEENTFNIRDDNYFSVLNRSIVIHIKQDDLGRGNNLASKSNGNSGTRIACGIILPYDL